jgi:5-methylcytosine-specific restriction endonuclease McrA|tara:strand:+ start:5507 stop:5779 length:273 start_codon:yes stop_codon:yes gene_type:complete
MMIKKRKRNYQKENEYKKRPEQIAARVKRNAARRLLIREGLVKKGDGTHVNHKVPLSKGGSNDRKNLSVRDGKKNSSYARNKDGSMKRKT